VCAGDKYSVHNDGNMGTCTLVDGSQEWSHLQTIEQLNTSVNPLNHRLADALQVG
jgi:hypothetical protein